MIFDISNDLIAKKDKLFKATSYDIRAYVGEAGNFFTSDAILTPEAMYLVGALMGSMTFKLNNGNTFGLNIGDTVVIGHDNGPTSKPLSDAFSDGLTDQGVNVYYIGIASSGQVYHNQGQLQAQGHVQITRSHVEVTTNGAKFAIGEYGIHTYLLGQMNSALAKGKVGRDAPKGKTTNKETEGKKLYTERMKQRYGEYFASNPRKIALNLFGGTAVEYKEMFIDIFGKDTVILGDKLNVNAGTLLADPTRKEMLARVSDFTATLTKGTRIYSFDLDADRLSVTEGAKALEVGHSGHYLGDDLAYILAGHKLKFATPMLMAKLPKSIARENADKILDMARTVYVDPRYSSGVRSYVIENGGISEYHRKGHSLWKETMTANLSKLAKLAGCKNTTDFLSKTGYQDLQIEASLHMFTSDIEDGTVRDDGLESVFIIEKTCDVLNIKSLNAFFAAISKRSVTKEIRTNSVSNEVKEQITSHIIDKLKSIFDNSEHAIVEFDGQVRIDWATGFIMYGMSNTSPKLTFMAEGSSENERNSALAYILALHNNAKKQFNDTTPMDVSENSFFIDDSSFKMNLPDKVDFNDKRVNEFAVAHKITL